MSEHVRVLRADGLGSPQHYYFACPECGWCGPMRRMAATAVLDEEGHEAAKVRAAELRAGDRR